MGEGRLGLPGQLSLGARVLALFSFISHIIGKIALPKMGKCLEVSNILLEDNRSLLIQICSENKSEKSELIGAKRNKSEQIPKTRSANRNKSEEIREIGTNRGDPLLPTPKWGLQHMLLVQTPWTIYSAHQKRNAPQTMKTARVVWFVESVRFPLGCILLEDAVVQPLQTVFTLSWVFLPNANVLC